jgi:selenocysteine lyase/cysteine desulfurase
MLSRPDFYARAYPPLFDQVEATRDEVAGLLGVPSSTIALTSSTSDGIALFLAALSLRPGDVVAVGRGSFISVPASLIRKQAEGVVVELIGEETGRVRSEDLARTSPKTRAVVIDWVNYWSGVRNDVQALARWCRQANIPLLVDGVQGVGATPFDFDPSDVAALACGGHKWLRGPEGTGFLYVAPWAMPLLAPSHHGYRSLDDPRALEAIQMELSAGTRVFEVGTLNTLGFVGLGEAIRALRRFGYARQVEMIQKVQATLHQTLAAVPDVELVTPAAPQRRAGILSFRYGPVPAAEVVRRLADASVIAGSRRSLVRLSPSADVPADDLCDALHRVL